MNNVVSCSHIDTVGLSLHSLRRAEIDKNLIECRTETSRALSLGEGVVLSENATSIIAATEVMGFRFGFHVSNQISEMNQVNLRLP
jgi:hypothetical protein